MAHSRTHCTISGRAIYAMQRARRSDHVLAMTRNACVTASGSFKLPRPTPLLCGSNSPFIISLQLHVAPRGPWYPRPSHVIPRKTRTILSNVMSHEQIMSYTPLRIQLDLDPTIKPLLTSIYHKDGSASLSLNYKMFYHNINVGRWLLAFGGSELLNNNEMDQLPLRPA